MGKPSSNGGRRWTRVLFVLVFGTVAAVGIALILAKGYALHLRSVSVSRLSLLASAIPPGALDSTADPQQALAALVSSSVLSEEQITDPLSGRPYQIRRVSAAPRGDEVVGYSLPPAKSRHPLLARFAGLDSGGCVLYADGHAVYLPREQYLRALSAQSARAKSTDDGKPDMSPPGGE